MKHNLRPFELKLAAILLGLAICLCSCSSSYSVSSTGKPTSDYSYQEMNEELKGRHVKIELKAGEETSAEDITISNDSVSWLAESGHEKSKVATQQLKRIALKDHFTGGAEWFLLGALGGAGVGWLSTAGESQGYRKEFGGAAMFFYGIIGAGIGLLTGAIIGHSYNYEFSTTEQRDSLQNGK